VSTGLARAISFGREVVREVRANAGSARSLTVRERQLLAEHQRAVQQHEADVRSHTGRTMAWRAASVVAGAYTGFLGVATVASAAATGVPGAVVVGTLTAGGAYATVAARAKAKELQEHPPVAALPPLPPPRLPYGTPGAAESQRIAESLMTLYDLGPSVTRLAPGAGQDLARAIAEVDPLLRGQVERLVSLNRLIAGMPGSRAAEVAANAAREVTARLRAGADALDELIVAGAAFLAAPDLADTVPQTLTPAISSLEAYAYGLRVANATQSPAA
jgi:hypothetical protein